MQNHLGQISHTHTHKHKTHTRASALNTKTNKIKKVKDVKVKKNNEKPDELGCENTFQFLVAFKNNQLEVFLEALERKKLYINNAS